MSDRYGVEVQKSYVNKLEPHPDACKSIEDLLELARSLEGLLAADLFCGAGGLSLGLEEAGIKSVVGVDFDDYALETYRNLFGGLTMKLDLSRPAAIEDLTSLLRDVGVDVIVGGPPCQPFSRAGRSSIRKLVERGIRSPDDQRRDLWQSFLQVVAGVRPLAVIIENVPDMALSDEGLILRLIVADLESQGYSVDARLLDAWRYGVPQHRQRLIIVALAERTRFEWPLETEKQTSVNDAISDLPTLIGGWGEAEKDGSLPYEGPQTEFQRKMRSGISLVDQPRVYDHVTRSVRDDDRAIFASMDSETQYSDVDPALKRYRDDIFNDKYKRLAGSDISRTIIAHLAKDGYGFIHPEQDRTISVREAARLQTFPDRVRFAGPPTAAFRQIGNAVPPLLGLKLGSTVLSSLQRAERDPVSTTELGSVLARWYEQEGIPGAPWLTGNSEWAVRVGEALLRIGDPAYFIGPIWGAVGDISGPLDVVSNQDRLRSLVARPSDAEDLEGVIAAAEKAIAGLSAGEGSSWRLSHLAAKESDRSVLFAQRGVLRVVARFTGTNVDQQNQGSHGRLFAASMIGVEPDATKANMALISIAQSICVSGLPRCDVCPLQEYCEFARRSEYQMAMQLDG